MSGEAAAYLEAIDRFMTTHNLPSDIASRLRKAGEELGELAEAAVNRDADAMRAEACDLCNVVMHIVTRLVGPDPWAALLENLDQKDRRYKGEVKG